MNLHQICILFHLPCNMYVCVPASLSLSLSLSVCVCVRACVHVSVLNQNDEPISCSGATSLMAKLLTIELIMPNNLPPYLH